MERCPTMSVPSAPRAARLFLVTAPQRTCPAPGCCCAAAATWTPVCTGSPTRAPSPRTPPGTRRSWSCSAPFIRRAALSWGSAGGCRSSTWPWGGTLLQDLGDIRRPSHTHPQADQVHPVRAQPGSLLHTLYGPRFSVNSSHHQAVDCPAPGLVLTLRAVDGVPEAMEHPSLPILGVQFHPERMSGPLLRPDTVDGAPIFRWFLALCGRTGPVSSSTQEVSQL